MGSSKAGIQRFEDTLEARGYSNEMVKLPENARTAGEAAKAIGCKVEQIAKSLIFLLSDSHQPMLIVASGVNRVNENRVSEWIGEPLGKANADFVREQTGFAIGGVPPLGHVNPIKALIDEDLFQYDEIWAAGGHPNFVFRLTPEELLKMTNGEVLAIR